MGRPRTELQALLKDICPTTWFQPQPNVQLNYPCIIYELMDVEIGHADNHPYRNLKRYSIMIIDRNPDSTIPDQVAQLPTASFNRFYTANNLNHTVYNVYF